MDDANLLDTVNPSLCRCPQCGGSVLEDLGELPDCNQFMGKDVERLPGGSLLFCKKCLLRFRYPVLSENLLNKLYDQADVTNWDGGPSSERKDFSLAVKFIVNNIAPGHKVLDVGCYTGDLLAKLPHTASLYGVEPNRQAGAKAATRCGATVWTDIMEIPENEQFDFILLTDVIEHVISPQAFLDKLRIHLRQGGYLLITTGDANNFLWKLFGSRWWYCSYLEHISFISIGWVKKYADQAELLLYEHHKFSYDSLSPVRWMKRAFLMMCYGLFGARFLRFYDKTRYYLSDRKVISVPTGCGVVRDHIFVVLRMAKK